MASSKRTIALIDSSKFGLSALLSIARLEELDAVIVDDGLAAGDARRLRGGGRQR